MNEIHIFINLHKKPFSNYEGLIDTLKNNKKKMIIFNSKYADEIKEVEHSKKKIFRFLYYKKLKQEIQIFKKKYNLYENKSKIILYIDEDGYISLFFFSLFKNSKKIIIQHGFLSKKIPYYKFIIRKFVNLISFLLFQIPNIGYGFGRASEDLYLIYSDFEKKYLISNKTYICDKIIKSNLIKYYNNLNIKNLTIDYYIILPSFFISSPFSQKKIFTILEDLIYKLNEFKKNSNIVIRPHYTNNILFKNNFEKKFNVQFDYSENHKLFFLSKVVFGFNSTMIYESIILNKITINLISNKFKVERAENLSIPFILNDYSIDKKKLFNLLSNKNDSPIYKIKSNYNIDIIKKILI